MSELTIKEEFASKSNKGKTSAPAIPLGQLLTRKVISINFSVYRRTRSRAKCPPSDRSSCDRVPGTRTPPPPLRATVPPGMGESISGDSGSRESEKESFANSQDLILQHVKEMRFTIPYF